jgi:putative endonuclease
MSGLGDFTAQPHTVGRGRLAEEVAAAWLAGEGYRIVERNHRNDAGEIDLVAWESDTLCFIEVKARAGTLHGPALAAVGWSKRRRVARAAALYLALRGGTDPPCRFDVLAVEQHEEGWRFTLVRGAFDGG